MNLHDLLKHHTQKKGMNQAEFARKMNDFPGNLWKRIREEKVQIKDLRLMCKVLGITIEELFNKKQKNV